MNRVFNNIKMTLGGAMVALLAVASVSCVEPYDDTELKTEIEQIRSELTALKESVEAELDALRGLVEGMVTVKSVEKMEDGRTIVTLSDDTRLTIYPEGAGLPANLVTMVEEDGVFYWAIYDETGTAVAIEVDGERVAVSELLPEIRVENDVIEVSFDGGKTWIATGYEQSVADTMIQAVEVVYSEWQVDANGNPVPLYCMIQLVDGTEVKVGMQSAKIILESDTLFVAYGAEAALKATIDGVDDYLVQMPKGWSCDVAYDAEKAALTLTFKAPTAEAVAAGAAKEGVAKLVVVHNGGYSAMASIAVSTGEAK